MAGRTTGLFEGGDIMKLYEIYFSPTGGTKKVTEIIGSAWTCEKERIDLMNPRLEPAGYSFTASDICIVAVPSFGGRVPETALERLKKMNGGGAKTVLAAVYGNRAHTRAPPQPARRSRWKPGIRGYADRIKGCAFGGGLLLYGCCRCCGRAFDHT